MKDLKKVLIEIEKSKVIISQERDRLRDIYYELGNLIESFDSGLQDLEDGKQLIESGLDSISQFV